MAPSSSKANYKTYEAQARMVRAIVAAHPEVKWNYKDIATCYGSDMTEHALNHRFRRLRAQSVIVREGRLLGLDMKYLPAEDLPVTQEAVDKRNIAKYFGQSTADGIQFQFRTIKKDADRLRQVEKSGGDVANCLSLGSASGSVLSTPSKPTPVRGTGSRTGTGGGRKRTRIPEIKRTSSDEDEDDDDVVDVENWSEREETPSKRPKTGALPGQKNGTPSRRAAAKASVTIAEATAKLENFSSDEQPDFDTPTPGTAFVLPPASSSSNNPFPVDVPASISPASIFGAVDRKPFIHRNQQSAGSHSGSAFTRNATDGYLTGGDFDQNPVYGDYSQLGDGEF